MASNRDRQSPTQGLIPPPVAAPRRRSPVNVPDTLLEGHRAPPIPARRKSLARKNEEGEMTVFSPDFGNDDSNAKRKMTFPKSNSMFSNDDLQPVPEMDSRFSLPQSTSGCTMHPDLDGLDFSGSVFPSVNTESRPRSSSTDEIRDSRKHIYPDISHAFRGITPQLPTSLQYAYNGSQYQTNAGVLPTSSVASQNIGGYGWNSSVFNNLNSGGAATSLASSQFYNSYSTVAPKGNLHVYPQLPSTVADNNLMYPANNYLSLFNTAGYSTNYMTSAAYDHNPQASTGVGTKLNYVPNIHPAGGASRESSASPSNLFPTPAPTGFDDTFFPSESSTSTADGDLIKLGSFLPEHEYLSLDYFDPLYSRGRKESISHSEVSSPQSPAPTTYSFGEAFPNLYEEHTGAATAGDDHIWTPMTSTQQTVKPPPIGFEAFNADVFGQTFGTSDEEFLRTEAGEVFRSPAYDAPGNIVVGTSDKPARPPSWRLPQDTRFEHLRKRTFIDPESESFCQMVADLKKRYLSTDEKTNQGFLINQIRECHMGSIQVKVNVHTQFASEPVSFTCDTTALVEHLISHVLYTVLPADPQPDTNKFLLKVYDRTEYLDNEMPLANFDYVHSCLKLDKDVSLELITCEEVSRPFIRTRDDDIQMLYFPKEYINMDGKSVSQEALSVLIDTFYHEVDVILEHCRKDGAASFQVQTLVQSVKAICFNLAKVETVEISKALDQIRRNVEELVNPSARSQSMFGSHSQDKDTQDAINVAVRCSLLEDLEASVNLLIDAVKRLVRMYCRTFLTDFFLGSSVVVPHDHLEVVKVKDNFLVCISSAHGLPPGASNRYDQYKIVCSLYHGTKKLVPDVSTTFKSLSVGLCERVHWDEWLNFERMALSTMPRETRLCLMLCAVSKYPAGADKNIEKGEVTADKKIIYSLGAASIQLFNEKGYLNQGPQLVPLMMGVRSDPIMPSCKTLLPDSVLLQVNLPDFDRTIFFPEPSTFANSKRKSFNDLLPAIRMLVHEVMEKESCSAFTAEEFEILWSHRHYMIDYPSLLPRILQAAQSWDWASLPEIYSLLRCWKTLHPMQAFELLLPQFPDLRVRQFAADCLNKIPSDDLIDFLPQMIQGLKFESYHNSPLAKLLLEQSCKSPRFAHQFFWLLKGAASQDATFKRRYELMFVALASVTGDALYQEFKKQEELVKVVTSVAEKVKTAKDKDNTLKRELIPLHEMIEKKGRILLPYNPSIEVVGLDMKSCSYFTSNAFPLKLVFKNLNPKADSHYAIYKVGDDLRQDMLTLQMIRIMDNLWLQKGLDLRMILFSCLATGPKKGIIELITESETLRKIQVFSGVTGSFKDRPIKEWLQKHNPTELEYNRAVDNFTYSCAGYCVATYVLGVCDRHNDNIMLKQSGHMFHIDFSKFLGDAQMFGTFKRDRVPFVLTSDMAYVINDGAKTGPRYQNFVDLCCQAFNILRQHADLFRSLFILMARSGIPGVTDQAVQYVQNALLPGQTEAQATATFTRMIEESVNSVFTSFNFFIHNLAQLKFSSHNEGTLLSFVPKSYNKDTDGKITSVELVRFQKRYTPDKHYIFILKVERENQKVPMYIFRQFLEFVEFRDKLNEMFPLITWPNFSKRLVFGRSNIRSVAESRRTEIINFLRFLWTLTAEISECELVYTFFHPLLRDEQETETNKLNVVKLREPAVQRSNTAGSTGILGEIKLSIQYKKDALQVMIMHVRGLSGTTEPPSPYVKTYLLPDPDKVTKLKTKTVKTTNDPTYNELLQYQLSEQEIKYRILQVTVWDSAVLKENNFLGAVYIRLRDLDLSKDNTCWHKLGRIQMPSF
ncbi:phosphatidylinositol 4-phosphate 3-kinase C2 domain-containing subunit beta-like [Physella acuta]|uniref:phosphatidylinositol 4-phosphate 3-kinase C2 domain-containing subunit beta-like n=1 Tax=Physella acuta TaxID=109671 RepID=UPI0027DB4053|nr:phosphatidylinositol 4-phosphate 3-kinase C2 domain-containing subunit beta-like [Physella acuta]XP_059175541.1 phosphatidylinositol 4-phosphate 3-kinase C2 domain-containing subunit beta-like [Physella acuta]XP_059175542.1 phosphatidylinositol 4-phosphate 3-kinase C2 domain-containing subunit beta-like [Physella acuta]